MARRSQQRAWRSLVWAPVLAVLAAAAILGFDRETGILPILELRSQLGRASERVLRLEQERQRLTQRVQGLRSDPFHIESVARSKLGMVRPNEVVVRFENTD